MGLGYGPHNSQTTLLRLTETETKCFMRYRRLPKVVQYTIATSRSPDSWGLDLATVRNSQHLRLQGM